MSEPIRIQRKRTRGWRMPENTIYVGRPTIFGNPFRPVYLRDLRQWIVLDDNGVDYEPMYNSGPSARRKAVELFVDDLTYWFGGRIENQAGLREAIEGLRGKNLACWCPVGETSERGPMPCHADVLLELANRRPA